MVTDISTNNVNRPQRQLFVAEYGFTPEHRLEHCAVLCQDGDIIAVGGESAFSPERRVKIFHLKNAYVTPGFIDSHIHGAGGFDASSIIYGQNTTIADMSRELALHGVTSFVPTVVCDEPEKMLQNLSLLTDMCRLSLPGADPVGIHLEGPFINPDKRGSMLFSAVKRIDLGYAKELVAAGKGLVKRVTFAPEIDGAVKLVEFLCENGISPSMGHSLANEEETLRAIEAGARCCTHLFNGMPKLSQREMNLTSVALTDPRVMVELITDGRHLHPRIVDLACRCKADFRVAAISDATMAAGMPSGSYRIGPTEITVENGFSRSTEGVLAGTSTLLDDGWHSLMSYSHTSETYAASAVSRNSALQLGLTDRGKLLPGMRADMAFFECGTNRPLLTVRRGEIVFAAEGVLDNE